MSEWTDVTVGEICEFKYGKALAAALRDGGEFPVYGSNGVIGSHSQAITEGQAVIVGRKGSLGEVSFSGGSCWPIDTTYFIDESSTETSLRWLYHRLSHLGLTALNRAAAIPGLNREDAYRQRLLLPPIPEQRRIALILDQAGRIRTDKMRVVSRLDELETAIFREMFEGSAWDVRELADAVDRGTIVTYGIVQAGPEFEGGVPYIRTGDIEGGRIKIAGLRRTDPRIAERFQRSRVRPGDIVMSIRATVGTTAVVPPALDGANLTQGTARISPGRDAVGAYLLGYLRSAPAQRWIKAQVKGATFREITLGRLRELPIPLPPLNLQREYLSRVEKLHYHRAVAQEAKRLSDELVECLRERAFMGKLSDG